MNIGTVAEAVTTLYGGDPADFVAVRKELAAAARTAGERDAAREIAALRKPTAAAAAVNHLDDGAISDVLALGEQMRAAQTSLDAATLKELSARRQELLQQIVTRHDLNGAPAEARSLITSSSSIGTHSAVPLDSPKLERRSRRTTPLCSRTSGPLEPSPG